MIRVVDAHAGPLLEVAREMLRGWAERAEGEAGILAEAEEVDALPHPYEPPAGACLVAMSGSEPLGAVFLMPHTGPVAGAGEVRHLYVVEGRRGHRVGRTLIDAVVRRATAIGLRTVVLAVDEVRAEDLALVESTGFRRAEVVGGGGSVGRYFVREVSATTH
ncbi:MAG: N-acetyltransferase family protein [Actinomycetes bacterium]